MLTFSLLLLASIGAGMINSVAGGGTFIIFPALLFAGLPPVAANASGTVANFPGQVTAIFAYRRDLRTIRDIEPWIFVTESLVGGLIGALLLLYTPHFVFAGLIPWLLLFATIIFAVGNFAPRQFMERFTLSRRAVIVVQFMISLYGGYFGGAVGFLMLAAFTLFGVRDIRAMNALRILLATLMNATAIVAFIAAGAVYWPQTLVMAAGSVVGAYAGAAGAKRVDPRLLKMVIIALGAVLSVYFFWHGA